MKHYTIPIFIPELACPFQCIYCDQRKITGKELIPDDEDIIETIESHLLSFRKKRKYIEAGFFGGSFTGLNINEQKHYLGLVQPYIRSGKINSIRLSTRPDYINMEILEILKENNVKTIELGAQSTDESVLKKSGRGHSVRDIFNASYQVKKAGFRLGLQMMLGLPGDTLNKAKTTAQDFINLGAKDTRIYPTLVIKSTRLAELYKKGKYTPLTLEESVKWAKEILLMFEEAGVNIIRMGLHPSEGFMEGDDLVAGPFHQSFRELVLTNIWFEKLKKISLSDADRITISVSPEQFNYAIGYSKYNKKFLLEHFKNVTFIKDTNLTNRNFHVDYH